MIINKVVKNSENKYADVFGGNDIEQYGDFFLDRTGHKWKVYSHDFDGVCKELNNKPHDCDFEEMVRHFAQVTAADCVDVVKLYDDNDSTDEIIEGYIDWQLGEFEYNEKTIEVEPDVEEMDITPVWLEIADWLRGKTWDEIKSEIHDSDYEIQPSSESLIVFCSESLEFSIEKRHGSIYLDNNVVVYDGDYVYEDYTIDDVVAYPLYEPKVDITEFTLTPAQVVALDALRGALRLAYNTNLKLFVTPELGVHAYNGVAASLELHDPEYPFAKSDSCPTGVDLEYLDDVIDYFYGGEEEGYGLTKKAA